MIRSILRRFHLWLHKPTIRRLNNKRMSLMDRIYEQRRVHGRSSHLQSRLNEVTRQLLEMEF